MKKALLIVSTGTSIPEARESITQVEKELAKMIKDADVWRAFTSDNARRILKGRGKPVPSMEEALEQLCIRNYTDVLIQPTYLLPGDEYDKVCEIAENYADRFSRLALGEALLKSNNDIWNLAKCVAKAYRPEGLLVPVGTGGDRLDNKVYLTFQAALRMMGIKNAFVGTLESRPAFEDVLEWVERSGHKCVSLVPLLLAPDHQIIRDIAGDSMESWKGRLESAGYQVTCHVEGLGQLQEVHKMFCDHFMKLLLKTYLVFEGRHEPIVTQEQWDKVRAVQATKSHLCVRKDRKPANPFANVLVCAKCGYAIKRNTPSANQVEKRKFRPWFRCGSKGCDCMISYCDIIEDKIVEAMREWWKDVTLKVAPGEKKEAMEETQLDMMRKQLKSHYEQQNQICNLLERGVYSEEMFLKRNAVLQKDIKELQSSIEELEEICHNKSEYERAREIFLPTTAHILDYYDRMTAEEKNRLWKLLMEKITYYRSPERPDSIEIHLYPRLGRFVNIS